MHDHTHTRKEFVPRNLRVLRRRAQVKQRRGNAGATSLRNRARCCALCEIIEESGIGERQALKGGNSYTAIAFLLTPPPQVLG